MMGIPAKTVISLVICTRNRAARLGKCLEAVACMQTVGSWELVLVDNGSTDDTHSILSAFAATAVFPVTVCTNPIPGTGRAKNTGWQAARGDIIAFTDDDCYVAPDYIDRIHDAFQDTALGFCGGRVSLFDPSDYPITITDREARLDFPAGAFISAGEIHGANMLFRRSILEAIGGFDPELGAGTPFKCEDVDALARALHAGWAGAYLPEITVAHHHGRKPADVPALRRSYSVGRGAYMAKFILLSATRRVYARRWYWEFRRSFRAGKEARVFMLWELEGALKYLLSRPCRALARRPIVASPAEQDIGR
jgi:glycosyltransferase involved in cell wall biosynthesis